ncbi:MAG: tRNA uridine-5-carboxymethylaminomethyl(34) synthesis GTPase MnmE [Pseudanabaenaceae cyanobacterium bins.68]|nr:tRNA uridine-5-carboxymethylaminomethyl(34) synthesis GTPase MnmE [Pseudanabaenaceae cyanobacterium bins.68]
MLGQTIAAIATAMVPEQGSVGIVRLSGDQAVAIAQALFVTRQAWQSHQVLYGHVVIDGKIIDQCLVLPMLAPRSYTREDVVEFHCHGGIILVQQVLAACLDLGARLAQPGEFTLRAFLHGRIDLTQAESIQDLVGAKSAQAAEMAIGQLRGKLAQPISQLRAKCLDLLAEIEARIDFEEDLPPLNLPSLGAEIGQVLAQAQQILATAKGGQLLRQGIKVAIVGRPNVGKSSLLNAWSQSDRAIVTDLPGTTRDIVDAYLVVGGLPVQVLDTAGIRATSDLVEQMGVQRSRQAAEDADLVLLVVDALAGWTRADQEILTEIKGDRLIFLVVNKIDLQPDPVLPDLEFNRVVYVAAARGEGIDQLEQGILDSVAGASLRAANLAIAINQRQAECLRRAISSLTQVQHAIGDRLPLDFWTIDLRAAISTLGEITGEGVTEAVLERIFSRFCIGK